MFKVNELATDYSVFEIMMLAASATGYRPKYPTLA